MSYQKPLTVLRDSLYPVSIPLFLVMLLFCGSVQATDGTQLIGIGAQQKGTGGAGVASPKDMTWVLLNPASIIDLGCRLDLNLELFAPYRTADPHGLFSNPFADQMSDDSMFYIPSMGYSHSCACGTWSWGIGLYGVSGMGVNYSDSRTILPKLFLKNYDRRTDYSVAKLSFAYAKQFSNGLTIGIAPQLDFARFRTDMLTLQFKAAGAEDGWDQAMGGGVSLGLYKRWEKFGWGAAYTSRQYFTKFHRYDDVFKDSMDIPMMFQTGISYDVLKDLEVVLDYKWINWAGIAQIGDKPIDGGFGWKDQHVIKAGATWYVHPRWTLRGGISYGNSPIEEKVVFANTLFPAVVEWHTSIGFTYAITKKMDFHLTYMHAWENKLKDNGQGDIFSILGKGTEISLQEDTLTAEFSYKFKAGGCNSRRLKRQNDEYEKYQEQKKERKEEKKEQGEGRF